LLARDHQQAKSEREVAERVANDPTGIAILSMPAARAGGLKMLTLDGAPATLQTARNGTYPLRLQLSAVLRGSAPPACNTLLQRLLSAEGERLRRRALEF
jgi:hypothetical protein